MCKTSFASKEAHGPACQHVKLSSQKSEDTLHKTFKSILYNRELGIRCLGFDHSVLAKIIAYCSFYDGKWPHFGVC